MPVSKESLEKKLTSELNADFVDVVDNSDGCGLKFITTIVSDQFNGKSLLQRQRLVNEILKAEMPLIHAFTQKTLTPEEYEKRKDSIN